MSPEIVARIDTLCDEFEKQWLSGLEPDPRSFLDQIDAGFHLDLAQQLMLLDAEYRRSKYGSSPTIDDYAGRFMIAVQDLQAAMQTLDPAADHQNTPGRPENDCEFQTNRSAVRGLSIRGYEILSELGHGGMGVVYKARQVLAGRVVALKTIRGLHLATQEQVLRFRAEAEAAGRLNHRAIVPIYEVGEDQGVQFFSMGFVEGLNLEEKAREQILSCRDAAVICQEIAEALHYAHQNGVIHRDIKPQNILIDQDGRPKLTDFGLAKLAHQELSLTGTGQVLGTAAFMPPEQATGKASEVGPEADVYSLGAVLYRCVTGRPPFQAATSIEILRQVLDEEPVPPRRLNREIDADIETLCLKCLEKEPARRFQTAAELSAELTRYLNHEPIHSRPMGLMPRAWRWCRRRPTIAASLALLMLLILVMSTGVPYVLWQKNELQEADLKKEQDARLIEQAESARELEQAGRQQAEQRAAANASRAATQEYYLSIMKVRELQMQPDPKAGWTWEALDLLQKAAASDADGKDPVILRSLIAETLMTPDLREMGRIDSVPNTHALAVSHDGKLLAAGDYAGNPSQIRIYRISTVQDNHQRPQVQFELLRTCSVNTTADDLQSELIEMGVQSGTINSEGMWALDFSPNDKNIAVGTRNGNLMIWKIDCDPPRILFDKRFPEKGTHRLSYSPDGRQIHINYSVPSSHRVFDVDKQTDHVVHYDYPIDFDLMPDGKVLASRDGMISRISAESLTEFVELTPLGGLLHAICVHPDRTVAIVGTVPSFLLDPITGEKGLVLQQLPSEPNRPGNITFAADATIAIAVVQPQNLKLWDAVSGQRAADISFPGNETPLICAGKEHDRIYVYSTVHTFAYQLRCAQPLPTNSGQTASEQTTLLSNIAAPVSVFAPGAQTLSCFALSHDQQHIAVVETASIHGQHTIPENYRARLRKLNVSDGRETERWTCSLLSSGENRNTLTEGDAVTFLHDDHKIAFTTPAIGNVAVVSASGFQFPSGVGIDVTQQSPLVTAPNVASWTGMKVPEVSATSGFRPAIALKLPRGLTQSRERMLLRLISGGKNHQYELADQHLDSSGWHLICLDHFEETFDSGTWRVEASLVESNLQFELNPGYSASNDESAIQLSHLYLLPTKLLKRGQTSPIFPLRLGPLARQKDGGLAAVIESWTLHQWGPELSESISAPWRDADNNEEDIRGVCAGTDGYVVGTDSGLVALVRPDGSQDIVERVNAEKGGYDPRDGVLATVFAEEAGLAAAGTLNGQIKLYNLQQSKEAPISVTEAHDREIAAMAITSDGQYLATGSADGVLKVWRTTTDRLELLFEIANVRTCFVRMEFSADGNHLYVLRQGERGIRRLDVSELSRIFSRNGLGVSSAKRSIDSSISPNESICRYLHLWKKPKPFSMHWLKAEIPQCHSATRFGQRSLPLKRTSLCTMSSQPVCHSPMCIS